MVATLTPKPAIVRLSSLFATRSSNRAPRRSWRTLCRAAKHPKRLPRPENAPGDFFVDHTCIDCDTCRWMAPTVFSRVGEMSAVTRQPESKGERRQALQALISCPTFSIHAHTRAPGELASARDSLPQLVPGCANVYHTGFHAEDSFGATPYLIRRPPPPADRDGSSASSGSGSGSSSAAQLAGAGAGAGASGALAGSGNIMVDVPRWNPLLASKLERMGGVRYIFLTHEDDVGEHQKWAAHFGATRIIHRLEANARQGTNKAEWQLEGEGPWEVGDDVQLIFCPGHTAGCVSLLYKPGRALFTGDHLAYSARLGRLTIFRAYNWHSVEQQLESVHKLLHLDFLHVLPGHGRRASFSDGAERDREITRLLETEGWQLQPAGRSGL